MVRPRFCLKDQSIIFVSMVEQKVLVVQIRTIPYHFFFFCFFSEIQFVLAICNSYSFHGVPLPCTSPQVVLQNSDWKTFPAGTLRVELGASRLCLHGSLHLALSLCKHCVVLQLSCYTVGSLRTRVFFIPESLGLV